MTRRLLSEQAEPTVPVDHSYGGAVITGVAATTPQDDRYRRHHGQSRNQPAKINVFFGPENRNGVSAEQYIDDLGAPLFGRFVQLFFDVAKAERLPSRDDLVFAHTW